MNQFNDNSTSRSLFDHTQESIPDQQISNLYSSKQQQEKCNQQIYFLASQLNCNTTSTLQEIHIGETQGVVNNCIMVGDVLINIKNKQKNENQNTMKKEEPKNELQQWQTNSSEKLQPHVWTLVKIAKSKLFDKTKTINKSSIIITGPSGSGKTYTTLKIIEYIASIHETDETETQMIRKTSLSEKFNHFLFIQESFGNAQTQSNQNSSRFGNHIQIYYSKEQKLLGAKIQTNQFERARVIQFNKEVEKNFHIFYYLLAAYKRRNELQVSFQQKDELDEDLLEDQGKILELLNSFDLSQDQYELFGQVDVKQNYCEKFVELLNHLYAFEFQTLEVFAILECIAGLIHLKQGNYEKAESLFKIENLKEALTSQLNQRGIISTTKYAESSVDGFIIDIYHNLFLWIEDKINSQLDGEIVNDSSVKYLNVYDSFGFESIINPISRKHKNGLQQLVQNYINEKLQEYTYQAIQKKEQDLMNEEGVQFSEIQFSQNNQVTKFYEKFFQLLSDNTIFQQQDEKLFAQVSEQEEFQNVLITPSNLQRMPIESLQEEEKIHRNEINVFGIRHTVGTIFYQIKGMIKKNLIAIDQGLQNIKQNSQNIVIKQLIKLPSKCTLHELALEELKILIKNLEESDSYFIKCVSYNNGLSDPFDQLDQDVKDYIKYFYENYQYKVSIEGICSHYDSLFSEIQNQEKNQDQYKEQVIALLQKIIPQCKIGKTLVFLKSEQKKELDIRQEEKKGQPYYSFTNVNISTNQTQQINFCQECLQKELQIKKLQDELSYFKNLTKELNDQINKSTYNPNLERNFGDI